MDETREVLTRLDSIDESLRAILDMLCPVCRERLVSERHPEVPENGRAKETR